MRIPTLIGVTNYIPPAGGGFTYATWNPADKGAQVTLSGGDLMATRNAGAGMVRATQGKSSGKWYWEITYTTAGNQNNGVANASASLTNYLTSDANGWGFWADDGNNNCAAGLGAFADGVVVGFALDMDAGTLTIYKNNALQGGGPMCTGITGTIYPAWSCENNAVTGTANFGATTMAYTAPGGYNQGVYI